MDSYRSSNGRNKKLQPLTPNGRASKQVDGLRSVGPVSDSYTKMQKSSDRRNLRLLIDSNDAHFPGLKRLKFRGKELALLPPEVFNLRELELLDLSPEREACLYYKLPAVPSTISKLVNLKVLIVDTNELVDLPPQIGYLSNLEHLALSNNCLSKLPKEISRLQKLSSLHAANNKIADFPKQILDLKELTFLDLSDNEIQKIPSNIKNLNHLETLIMFANQLRDLPDELCDLKELRMLWLGDNYIRVLPRHFGQLRFLDWDWHYTSTTLDGNPLEHPPMEICRKGPKAIEHYLAENWTKIQSGRPIYTPNPSVSIHDYGESRSNSSGYEFGDTLDIDPRLVRNLRRGSIPIPSPIPDGLAALDTEE